MLPKCTQSWALLWQIWLPKGSIPPECMDGSAWEGFLTSQGTQGDKKNLQSGGAVQGREMEMPLSPSPCTSAGVPLLLVSIPCCVLNQQEIVPLPSLSPWSCSPGTASPQSWGGKGEGRGYCPNALSHVITPVQCPTQLLITTRVKLSSTVSE